MILTAALAISLTVAITAYAVARGRSPVFWGGTSVAITGASMLVAWTSVQVMGTSDLVFDRHGAVVGMLVSLAGPVVALLGNGALASRLAALPMVRPSSGTSWQMWRVGDRDNEGCECQLSAHPNAIVAVRGADELFRIPRARLAAVDVDGESLVLRDTDGRQIRLVLTDGDPDDRSARIGEIGRVKHALELASR